MEPLNLDNLEVPPAVLNAVSGIMARVYEVVPIRYDDGTLTVAIADLKNKEALGDLAYILDCRVEPLPATADSVERAIKKYYPENPAI